MSERHWDAPLMLIFPILDFWGDGPRIKFDNKSKSSSAGRGKYHETSFNNYQ